MIHTTKRSWSTTKFTVIVIWKVVRCKSNVVVTRFTCCWLHQELCKILTKSRRALLSTIKHIKWWQHDLFTSSRRWASSHSRSRAWRSNRWDRRTRIERRLCWIFWTRNQNIWTSWSLNESCNCRRHISFYSLERVFHLIIDNSIFVFHAKSFVSSHLFHLRFFTLSRCDSKKFETLWSCRVDQIRWVNWHEDSSWYNWREQMQSWDRSNARFIWESRSLLSQLNSCKACICHID